MDKEKILAEIDNIDIYTFARIEGKCFPEWVKMIKTQKELYYYTSLEALINGICKEKDTVCLWATRWSHLNDPDELQLGISNLGFVDLSWFNDAIKAKTRNNHSVSFSFYRDYLPMWKMYGNGGNGVMLVFNTDELVKQWGGYLQPCLYKGTKEYNETRERILELKNLPEIESLSLYQKQFVMIRMVQMLVSITKNDDYLYEKEARIIGVGNSHFNDEREEKYRLLGNNIIPYVETIIPKTALKEICLGPLVNPTLNKSVLGEFLFNKGFNDVDITSSEIKYR